MITLYKITDLPPTLGRRGVTVQYSALLDRVINIKGLINGIKEDDREKSD